MSRHTFALRQAKNLDLGYATGVGSGQFFPTHLMGNTSITSPSETRLVEALEALLDLFLDGRMDELSVKEQDAYDMASAALSEVASHHAA